jgi:acyl-CoA reductase-like NAD-dependent aldehyde dehydrogenase
MKKMLLIAPMILVVAISASAQGGGGFQRRTVEERVQTIHQKMDSAFKLDKAKAADVDSAFASYYRASDKVREDMMAGGGQVDRQAMMEKMQPLMTERDKKLEGILSADQYKTWKETIEPSMRGGGGRPRGNGK